MTLFQVQDLRFGSGTVVSRHCVSFELEAGQALWIRGSSGAGKSSLLRALARLDPHSEGDMALKGVKWQAIPAEQWRRQVTYVHQRPVLLPGSVFDNLERAFTLACSQSRSRGRPAARALLQALQLPASLLVRDAATLSFGEAARVSLARALLIEPRVLLLDEPTASVDPQSCEAIAKVLRDWLGGARRAIVGVSHENRIVDLVGGRVLWLEGHSLDTSGQAARGAEPA